MNVCMVGYGMMGVWHSEALQRTDAVLHTVVGRRPDAAQEFAQRYGYRKVAGSLEEALADPEIDVVILGTPSDQHEAQAIACLEAGKHTLIEIPIAMSLKGAERVVAAGEKSGKIYGLSHPMRFRREREALLARTRAGEENIRHIAGRFFIKRLVNIGATGYQRSWTDNILWHHFCHFVDLGMYLFDGAPIRRVQSHYGPCHPQTGIPMECVVLVETERRPVAAGARLLPRRLPLLRQADRHRPRYVFLRHTGRHPEDRRRRGGDRGRADQRRADHHRLHRRRAREPPAAGLRPVGAAGDARAAAGPGRVGRPLRRPVDPRPTAGLKGEAMRENLIRSKWAKGEAVVNGWLAIPSAFSAETMAHAGWDSLTLDMQHGVIDYQAAAGMLAAISTTSTMPIVRVPWLDPGIIMKMLDAGAYGIICPMVNNAADAETLVAAMRYPPRGTRSFGPIRALLYAGPDYAKEANRTVVAFAMIETRQALDNLDDILRVDGLDAIYVGPADLSLALGCTPRFDQDEPAVVEAIDLIVRKAKEHGVVAGIHNGTPEYALKMVEKGFQLVTIASDARLMAAGAQAVVAKMRSGRPAATGSGY